MSACDRSSTYYLFGLVCVIKTKPNIPGFINCIIATSHFFPLILLTYTFLKHIFGEKKDVQINVMICFSVIFFVIISKIFLTLLYL